MNAEEIFLAAVEIFDRPERIAYIKQVCGENRALCAEVESLIQAHDEVGDFLERPLISYSIPGTTPEHAGQLRYSSGTNLGRYEIIRRLGVGGMGEVYLARDVQLQRDVGIKVLAQVHTANPTWLQRFFREAKVASAVNHPNILTVYEIGQWEQIHFIVTEYIEGITLRERMTSRSMPLSEILETAIQTANALTAAHSAGIVHRDLKPENIMIRGDGLIKVLDFGLARHLDPSEDSQRTSLLSHGRSGNRISVPGSIMGTIHYMSPEQARGLHVDTRSDIFSFGVLLYEMLNGQHPFPGATSTDVLVAILDKEPLPLLSRDDELPVELERLVNKLLRKDCNERYQSASELCIDLKLLLQRVSQSRDTSVAPGATPDRTSAANILTEGILRVGTVSAVDRRCGSDIPEVRYTCSGDINIAYQVFGDGAFDLVFVMGWVSHLEWFWKEPSFARFLRRLGTIARVILFDKRGTGLSDRVPVHQLPTLEQRMDDVRAVMDAVDSQQAVLCGISEGGPLCTLFAATYPQKTIALMMIGSYARRLWAVDYPWGVREDHRQHFLEEIRREWGGPVGIEDRAPSKAQDANFREWWATYLRMGASPGAALALTQMNAEIDIRPILRLIQRPTLVVHRRDDRCLKVEEGRYLADHIPGAKFVELPGEDHLPFVGDQDAVLSAIEDFLARAQHASGSRRVLATVLATQPIPRLPGDSTPPDLADRLDRYRALALREVELFRGTGILVSGDRILAAFDGPSRAIRAAMAISDSARRLGLKLQAGLHTGECDVTGTSISGSAVDVARQISEIAEAQDVVVSGTIKDLVAGSGIQFSELPAGEIRTGSAISKLFRVLR